MDKKEQNNQQLTAEEKKLNAFKKLVENRKGECSTFAFKEISYII